VNRGQKKGFTLVELLVVVIIIGILATIAVPQYAKMIEKAKGSEARAILGMIRTGEELHKVEHGIYTDNTDILVVTVPLDSSPEHYFKYDIDATTTSFTAKAMRKTPTNAKTGKDLGYTNDYNITINEQGRIGQEGTI